MCSYGLTHNASRTIYVVRGACCIIDVVWPTWTTIASDRRSRTVEIDRQTGTRRRRSEFIDDQRSGGDAVRGDSNGLSGAAFMPARYCRRVFLASSSPSRRPFYFGHRRVLTSSRRRSTARVTPIYQLYSTVYEPPRSSARILHCQTTSTTNRLIIHGTRSISLSQRHLLLQQTYLMSKTVLRKHTLFFIC